MPDFCTPSSTPPAAPRAGFRPLSPTFSPTRIHEEPSKRAASSRAIRAVKSDWDPRTETTDHSRDGLLLAARIYVAKRRTDQRTRQRREYEALLPQLAKETP